MEKKSSYIRKGILWIGAISLGLFILVATTSPYDYDPSYDHSVIQYGIDIDAPSSAVYRYLSNSQSAAEWSVYVHHITTLNADLFKDGAVGSIRRCFTQSDEKGNRWDELIVEDIPNIKRKLQLFNLINFPISAEGLVTEQLYETLPHDRTRLRLTLFYEGGKPGIWDAIKTHLASYKIRSIFKQNMMNIKNNVESLQHE